VCEPLMVSLSNTFCLGALREARACDLMTRMAMTQQQAPRRSNGCLWGCLAVLAFIFLPLIAAGGYGAWFLYQGFRHDPVLCTVTELARRDGLAHQILGD